MTPDEIYRKHSLVECNLICGRKARAGEPDDCESIITADSLDRCVKIATESGWRIVGTTLFCDKCYKEIAEAN